LPHDCELTFSRIFDCHAAGQRCRRNCRGPQITPEPATPINSPHLEQWEKERAAQPGWWWATLIGPPLSFIGLIILLSLLFSWSLARAVLVRALISFFVVGRMAILEPTQVISAEALVALIVYMDLMAALFIAPHVGFLFGVPWVGKRLMVLVEDSEAVLNKEDRKRWLTFLALVAFVFTPVTATGSVGGAVLGRLLGLSRILTISAVLAGSVLSSAVMYLGSVPIRALVRPDAPLFKAVGIGIVAVAVFFLNRRYRSALKRMRRRRKSRG
jgi:uncharacterized membrane protein